MKNLKMMKPLLAMSFALYLGSSAFATESSVSHTADEAGNSVKKTYRNAKDKTCEMVNGKMQCLGKKIKHKMENASDAISTEAKEIKH